MTVIFSISLYDLLSDEVMMHIQKLNVFDDSTFDRLLDLTFDRGDKVSNPSMRLATSCKENV